MEERHFNIEHLTFTDSKKKRSKSVYQPGDRITLIGPSNCGKTVVIKNLLTKRGLLPKIEKVYIFTSSLDDYADMRERINEELVATSGEELVVIIDPSSEEAEAYDTNCFDKNECVIFDDILGHKKIKDLMLKCFVHGRHTGSIYILTSQANKEISSTIRGNSSCLMIFPSDMNTLEIRNTMSVCPAFLDKEDFKFLLKTVAEKGKPHFLNINKQAKEGLKIRCCFHEEL